MELFVNILLFLIACAHYFYIFHERKHLKNCEKGFLFHQKSSFCSRDIQIFVAFSSPLSYVGIQKRKLFNTLRSNEGLIHKLGQLTKYYIKKIFMEKYAKNMHQNLVSDLYLILVNIPKYSHCIQGTFL